MFSYYFWIYIGASLFSSTASVIWTTALRTGGCIAYMELLLQTRSEKSVMRDFLIAGVLMSCVHFAGFLANPDGGMLSNVAVFHMGKAKFRSGSWFFLKHDNGSVYYFIPVAVMLLYYTIYHNRKTFKYFFAYTAFLVFMFIYRMSATAMVVCSFMALSLMYLYFGRKRKRLMLYSLFNYKTSVIMGLICVIIPLLMVGGGLALEIAALVGKSATFSGRDQIWAKSFIYILQNPITGLGNEDSILTTAKIGINHCHNLIVQNLYTGGIIALFLFFMIMIRYKPKRTDKFKTAIFSVGILCFFVTAAFDWYPYYPLPMSLFVFNYYVNMRDATARIKPPLKR